MGFNGVRKHQKIEDPRYLYWADRLGLLVWEEMPSAYRFTRAVGRAASPASGSRRSRATTAIPCIVAWVPFNESWGVPNLPGQPGASGTTSRRSTTSPGRSIRRGRSSATTAGRASRPTSSASTTTTPTRSGSRERYQADEVLPRLFRRERPGGRLLVLDGDTHGGAADRALRVRRHRVRGDPAAPGATRGARPRTSSRGSTSELLAAVRSLALLRRLLLHAVRRHLPGGQRSAVRRPHAEDSARADRRRDPRCGATHARASTGRRRPDDAGPTMYAMFKRALTKPDGATLILYARPPIADVVDAPSPSPRRTRRTRTCAGIRCAASGWRTPATGRTGRSCRRRSTTRSRRRVTRRTRPRCRRATGTWRSSKTCFPTLTRRRRRAAAASIVPTRARARRLRGRGVHPGPDRLARGAAALRTSSCCSRSGPTATRARRAAGDRSTCSRSRTAASRSG